LSAFAADAELQDPERSMSNVPSDLKYTKSHEWVRALPDGTVEVGITDHAQHALGDLVFVEVPEARRKLAAGEPFAVVESVKAASDVYSPIAGEVTEGNPALAAQPEVINSDAYGQGWLMRLRPSGAVPALMTAAEYQKLVAEEGG
jgi:glycine cleavage system H protein